MKPILQDVAYVRGVAEKYDVAQMRGTVCVVRE